MASLLTLGCFPFQFWVFFFGGVLLSLCVSRWVGLTSFAECSLVVQRVQL